MRFGQEARMADSNACRPMKGAQPTAAKLHLSQMPTQKLSSFSYERHDLRVHPEISSESLVPKSKKSAGSQRKNPYFLSYIGTVFSRLAPTNVDLSSCVCSELFGLQ